MRQAEATNNLDSYWMGFTGNRQFKANPRLFVGASGMHYTTADGRQVLDGMAGMWCVNAGHCRPEIAQAIAAQAAEMDYAPAFQMGHPKAFELAARLAAMLPGDLDHVFFTNSGSESVDTALKIALAYHRAKGEATRVRLIGRARGYHGACIGGTSVGGIANNRKAFGALLPAVDHLAHTFDLEHNAFSRGEPAWGAHLADELERLVALHDASTIAAVIVEPVACSTGVLVPPKGYLSRLRGICDRHGILLIFDEVITGFGRMGKPFAADYYGVRPDLMTVAKGLSNGAVPMGAVFVRAPIYQAFMNGPVNAVELFHGYTYSAHPLATAASLATLDVYRDDDLFDRAAAMAPYFETAIHTLDSAPHVIDVRNIGMMGAIELAPLPGQPAERAFQAFLKLYEAGLLVRTTGDTIALSPPLIIERRQIDRMIETIGAVLRQVK